MCRLFESIKVENGRIQNREYHQWRIEWSMKACFPDSPVLSIEEILHHVKLPQSGVYKAKLVYNETLQDVSFEIYSKKSIDQFMLINADFLTYDYKWFDRQAIDEVMRSFANHQEVIFIKNGLISDTSFSNLVFFNGSEWLTPRKPLLRGTKRQALLNDGEISEADISENELNQFTAFRMINAMLEFDKENEYSIDRIKNF